MKKMIFTLVAMLAMAVTANAMSYERARNEALFLTDKMAYELNLTDAQYEAAYEINLDYLMSVTDYRDVNGIFWEHRNADLRYILYSWQWDLFRAATFFFRPLTWVDGIWHFGIYARYPHRDYFYFGRPHFYASYRGGHSWRLNGGRSYYEGRRDHFRPGHVERDRHVGMRNGWDRGDYRGNHGHSSTHITGPDRRHDNRGSYGNHNSHGNSGNHGSYGSHGNSNNNHRGYRDNNGYGVGSNHNNGSSHSSGSGSFGGNRHSGSSHSSGSGSFGGSRNSGSSHSSSHSSGNSRSSGSHFSGSHGSSHSSGGQTRGGGDRGGSSRR
jgi:hypothetical protein